jgi:integrase
MLSDAKCRNAKTQAKIMKLADSSGLYLWVYPDGRKYWRLRYWQLGKEKSLSLGVYPDISLKDARDRRDVERKKLNNGLDPSQERKAKKIRDKLSAEYSFEAIGREWHGKHSRKWSAKYAANLLRRLELDIFPKIGSRPIGEITPLEVLSALRAIEARGAHDLSHRVQQWCGQVFGYAIVTARAERNPVNDLRGALTPIVRKHNAYLKADELPEFLKKLDEYDGAQTKLAMKFLLLTFVRTGEMRGARWSEFDMDKAEWRIPAERMKMREQHIVPLSKQALAVLKELTPLTGYWEHVFPNQHKPKGQMSENTILYALYRMGYHGKSTGHGFRATASTILNEHGFAPDVIERQLAHAERNSIRKAYNHAQYIAERRKMMQWWADYLDSCAGNTKK